MSKYKLKSGTKALLYFTACALNNAKADITKVSPDDFERLSALAHRHNIGAITAIALKKSGVLDKDDYVKHKKKWESVHAAAVKRRVLFDIERERLLKILEAHGIWYCPLKGVILQELYPAYEMREMSDNDILYDKNKRAELLKIMQTEEYVLEDHGVTNHDMFTKAPVYNFEFHTRLFMHTFSTRFTDYYNNIFKRLIKDEDKNYSYRLNDNDFYIYMTAHAYKHFNEGGTGIRSLTDAYIFNKNKSACLDYDYITAECKKLGIFGFERMLRHISEKLFINPDKIFDNIASLNQKEREFLSYISFTGSYCTREDFIKSRLKRAGSKKKYIISRLFPNESYYKEAHPFLYKNKILIPVFLIYRAGKMLLTNNENVKKEIGIVLNIK